MKHVDHDAAIKLNKSLSEQEKIDMSLDINDVAAEAWNATKDKADPAFNDCILDHKMKQITAARSVADHGLPSGEMAVTEFDKKVAELLANPDKTEAAIRKAKAAALQAQADDLTAKAKALTAEAKK